MNKIFGSASKLAFLSLMFTACVAFLYEVIRGFVILEPKDFMVLAAGAAAFYFAHKGDPSNSDFAGK